MSLGSRVPDPETRTPSPETRIPRTRYRPLATLTQFLAALDSRVRVAVLSEVNTEDPAEANVEPPGSADDAEQNVVPALARGIDRADRRDR